MNSNVLPLLITCAFCLLARPLAASEEAYKPLFSQEMLESADPETRKRLEALDRKNREQWHAKQQADGATLPASAKPPGAAVQQSAVTRSGGLYRWVDAQGNVQFTDRPPPGAERVEVDVQRPDERSRAEHKAVLADQKRMLDYFESRNAQERRDTAARVAQQEERQQLAADCRTQFNEMQDYRRGGAVFYDVDESGNRVYFSEEELEARVRDMEADYRRYCGPLPAYDL